MGTPSKAQLQHSVDADLSRGIWSIPLVSGLKRPGLRGWQHLRIDSSSASDYFGDGMNRGRLLGVESSIDLEKSVLVAVDLDVPEARLLAPRLLPSTPERGGRSSPPDSHYFYRCPAPPPTRRFTGADGERYLDLLSTGTQILVPPSIHPCGEPYAWTTQGDAAAVDIDRLLSACQDVALGVLLARAGACLAPILASQLSPSRVRRIHAAVESIPTPLQTAHSSPEGLVMRVRSWLSGP